MWRVESIVRSKAHPCSTSLSIDFYRSAALRADFSELWFPLRSIGYRSDFLVAYYIGDIGSAALFELCQLFYLCIQDDSIILWFRWFLGILNHILGGFPFGITLLHLIFHWNTLIFFCSDMRILVSAWRGRLVARAPWQVFHIIILMVFTIHESWDYCVRYILHLRIFPFFSPCPGLDVGCPWCYCLMPKLGLCPWDLRVCL